MKMRTIISVLLCILLFISSVYICYLAYIDIRYDEYTEMTSDQLYTRFVIDHFKNTITVIQLKDGLHIITNSLSD